MKNKIPLIMFPLLAISCGVDGQPPRRYVLDGPEPEEFERIYMQDDEPSEGARDDDIWLRGERVHKRVDGHWVHVRDFGGNNKFFLKGLLNETYPRRAFRAAIRTLLLDNLTYSSTLSTYGDMHYEDGRFNWLQNMGPKELGMRNKDRFVGSMQGFSTYMDPSEYAPNFPANGNDVYYWRNGEGEYCRFPNWPEPSPSPLITEEEFYYRMFRAVARNHMPLWEPTVPYPLKGEWEEGGDDYCFHTELPDGTKYEIRLALGEGGRYMTHCSFRSTIANVQDNYYGEYQEFLSLSFFDFHKTPRIDIPDVILDSWEAWREGAEASSAGGPNL